MRNMDATPGNKVGHNLENREVVVNDLDKVIDDMNNTIADYMTRKKLTPAEDILSQLQKTLISLERLRGKVKGDKKAA